MAEHPTIASRHLTLLNELGLHLRPAAQFARMASSFKSLVWVECNGMRADGKSVLDLTCLAIPCGTTLGVEALGPDAESAVAALSNLILHRFQEPLPDRPIEA